VNIFILALIAYSLICGYYCATLARKKGKNKFTWFFGGVFFGLFALLVLGVLLPSLDVGETNEADSYK